MIVSFGDKDTEKLFRRQSVKRFRAFERAAQRKIQYLHSAKTLDDLRSPPGNRLEALKGDRNGQFSIRINQQWRICFQWSAQGPQNVEIVDYH